MSLAILRCRAQYGTEAPPVTIEVFLSGGLPAFTIVGMAETAVRESKDRVRGALMSSGFEFPQQRITISLGPAEMRKIGGRFDLPIALGILAARRQYPLAALDNVECYGELALNGELRPVSGLLPAVVKAHASGRSVIVPQDNAAEAALSGARVVPAASLLQVIAHLAGRERIDPAPASRTDATTGRTPDLLEVKGQQHAKRALEIAAARNVEERGTRNGGGKVHRRSAGHRGTVA
jgi:magnesium chelatase family protein